MNPLGKGATSVVYRVSCKQTGNVYALKVLSRKDIEEKRLESRLLNEINVHK